ncbi:MAG: hypothetical protein ACMUEL_00825 [Flavobacteriales bacterium Tduv]
MIRSIAQIRFSELCMKLSTRRDEFFKRLNPLIHLVLDGKEIKKYIKKSRE